jgi:hypothetical protein
LAPLLRHVAGKDILHTIAQRHDDRLRQRRRSELRRRQRLVPLVVDRSRKYIDDEYAAAFDAE